MYDHVCVKLYHYTIELLHKHISWVSCQVAPSSGIIPRSPKELPLSVH